MSDLILPSVVVALAHKRLREASTALTEKLTATQFDARQTFTTAGEFRPPNVVLKSRVEHEMLALLSGGQRMLAGHSSAPVPVGLDIGGVGEVAGVGKFAVLGSSGFTWGDYAAHFTDDALGRSGAMRRGSFDANYSSVSVPSTQFAIRAGQLARSQTINRREIAEIDAFAGGLLAAIAHDIVVGPVLRGVRADLNFNRHTRRAIPGMSKMTSQSFEAVLGGQRGAGTWQSWWPQANDVPDAIYEGYAAAAAEVYGFLDGAEPPGLASFLDNFETPPALDKQRLRAGVSFLTQDTMISSWGIGTWYAVFLPAILSAPTALLVGRHLEPVSGFFDETSDATAMDGLQLYSIASGMSSLTPFILSMHVLSQVPGHTRVFTTSLVSGILRLISAPLTVGLAAVDLDGAAWTFFALQAAIDLYSLISGFIDLGVGNPVEAFIGLVNSMPFVFGLLGLGLGAMFEKLDQNDEVDFWVPWAISLAVLALVGLIPAAVLADGNGVAGLFEPGESPSLPVIASLEALQAAVMSADAATFDDSTLLRGDAAPDSDGPTLLHAARHGGDGNSILRLWWEGDGDLTIAHDNNRIEFVQDDATETEIVLGPHQADVASIASELTSRMPDLQVSIVDEAVGAQLAWPHALKDPGDDESTIVLHDTNADEAQPVGTTEEDAYVLRAAPRAVLATRTGVRPNPDELPETLNVTPLGNDLEQSALGVAGDLAAMLVAGAVPSLAGATAVAVPALANPTLRPVHQIFKNWNLDERRLNEWRAIVVGGAATEKVTPADHDAGMRRLDARSSPYVNAAPQGDDLLNDMGWVPTWRAWLRMASDVTSDASAPTAERYTPVVARRDGTVAAPTNLELSDAMRFLFDLR